MSLVLCELSGSVGTLTLNNPSKRNALSRDLINDLIAGFEQLREQKARVAILRAPAGSKVFSAGHDVHEIPRSGRDPLAYNDPLRQAIRAIELFPAPVIAMIEGSVWGGACEVVLSCDLIVAAEDVTFAITPARMGVPYNVSGILNFMNVASLALLRQMIFTARPVSVQRAWQTGMVNEVVPAGELEAAARKYADQILENSPLSVAAMKEQIRILCNASPVSADTFERLQGLRRSVYDSQDYQEGIAAFLEKRKPAFRGC